MKRFLITYTYALNPANRADWHKRVTDFINEVNADPALGGRIRYRCMKAKDADGYFHLAEAADDEAIGVLRERAYFKRYAEETQRAGGGSVVVTALETIADTGG